MPFVFYLFIIHVFFFFSRLCLTGDKNEASGQNWLEFEQISFFWHAKSDSHFINKAAVTLSQIVARK